LDHYAVARLDPTRLQHRGEAVRPLVELAKGDLPLRAVVAEPVHGQLRWISSPAADDVAGEVETPGDLEAEVAHRGLVVRHVVDVLF
jgi:hypothetical protein